MLTSSKLLYLWYWLIFHCISKLFKKCVSCVLQVPAICSAFCFSLVPRFIGQKNLHWVMIAFCADFTYSPHVNATVHHPCSGTWIGKDRCHAMTHLFGCNIQNHTLGPKRFATFRIPPFPLNMRLRENLAETRVHLHAAHCGGLLFSCVFCAVACGAVGDADRCYFTASLGFSRVQREGKVIHQRGKRLKEHEGGRESKRKDTKRGSRRDRGRE